MLHARCINVGGLRTSFHNAKNRTRPLSDQLEQLMILITISLTFLAIGCRLKVECPLSFFKSLLAGVNFNARLLSVRFCELESSENMFKTCLQRKQF